MIDQKLAAAYPMSVAINIDGAVLTSKDVNGGGLTKRELFAAMAMQGWMSAAATAKDPATLMPSVTAKMAVNYADALIEELNSKGV